MEEYWDYIRTHKLTTYSNTKLNWNLNKPEGRKHKEIIELAATAGWGLAKHELTIEQFEKLLAGEAETHIETLDEHGIRRWNTMATMTQTRLYRNKQQSLR